MARRIDYFLEQPFYCEELKGLRDYAVFMASPSQNVKRFSRRNKLIIAVLAMVAVLSVSFWVTQEISFWPSNAVKPNIASIQPITGYYLTFQGNVTKIFVVSATVTSGSYSYHTYCSWEQIRKSASG